MEDNWLRFSRYLFNNEELGLQLDISKVKFEEEYLSAMETKMQPIYKLIGELERGEIFNPDERRMVGHYWLRSPELAPSKKIAEEIYSTLQTIKQFADQVHSGILRGEKGLQFKNVLVIGIGGSSLGPRFLSEAFKKPLQKLELFFIDNTDPDGMDRVLDNLKNELDQTLSIVISKSGGTIETRNGMEETRIFYRQNGLEFTKHAVCITQAGSRLDLKRIEENWLMAFPMWDWVGGRTSVLSAVGLLPLALQGIDIDRLLTGARKCDELTRSSLTRDNPAALLALMWYAVTEGRGGKEMVILPYKDRLRLLTQYLQQLIMESLGKETDLDGSVIHHGISVFGNKGSTDQHSYLQQLLDGPDNFFVTFLEVLKDRDRASVKIAENSTSGDYLHAFLLGTRKALTLKGRQSITITIREINEMTLGGLLALFERTVSIYALLIHINAYHQPAVELGKKMADEVIVLKNGVIDFLHANKGNKYPIQLLAEKLGSEVDLETLFKILQHLVNNPDSGIRQVKNKETSKDRPLEIFYQASE